MAIFKKCLAVFVSSTFLDLKKERQAVVETILELGHFPQGMELFSGGDLSQWETIKKWIDDSDIFVLVLGFRYGSIEKTSGKSYIQLEYEYAITQGKPYFAVVLAESIRADKVAEGKTFQELANPKLYEEFRGVVTDKMCSMITTVDKLRLEVFKSLSRIDTDKNPIGWVKADQAGDASKALQMLKEKDDQIQKLQAELSGLKSIAGEEGVMENTLERLSAIAIDSDAFPNALNVFVAICPRLQTPHYAYTAVLRQRIIDNYKANEWTEALYRSANMLRAYELIGINTAQVRWVDSPLYTPETEGEPDLMEFVSQTTIEISPMGWRFFRYLEEIKHPAIRAEARRVAKKRRENAKNTTLLKNVDFDSF